MTLKLADLPLGIAWDETRRKLDLVDKDGERIPGVISVSVESERNEPVVATVKLFVRQGVKPDEAYYNVNMTGEGPISREDVRRMVDAINDEVEGNHNA